MKPCGHGGLPKLIRARFVEAETLRVQWDLLVCNQCGATWGGAWIRVDVVAPGPRKPHYLQNFDDCGFELLDAFVMGYLHPPG